MKRRIFWAVSLAVAGLLLAGGCASTSRPLGGLLDKVFGRKAEAVKKNEQKIASTEDAVVTAAQFEVAKTQFALTVAPDSKPVEVARRTNNNAYSLLNQRSPLTVGQLQEAEEIVKGLLSIEESKRIAAEARQAEAEKGFTKLSQELAVMRVQNIQLIRAANKEAADNLALANDLRYTRIVAGAAVALNIGLALLAFAYKANIGRLQEGAADVFAFLQKKDAGLASASRTVMGVVLNKGEQVPIFQKFSALATAPAEPDAPPIQK